MGVSASQGESRQGKGKGGTMRRTVRFEMIWVMWCDVCFKLFPACTKLGTRLCKVVPRSVAESESPDLGYNQTGGGD